MDLGLLHSAGENVTNEVQPPSLDKIISFKDPRTLFFDNWFVLVLEWTIYTILFKTIKNAKQRGAQEVFLLVSALVGAISLEILQQIPHTGYQLWWYHLGMVNLMQRRVPAYVPSFVALVLYYSDYMTRNTKLPIISRCFADAFIALLLIFPCLWLAPNLLVIMVHFDDAIFLERFLNVPYTQMTYLFVLFFHMRYIFVPAFEEIELHERNFFRYLRCSVQSGMVAGLYSLVITFLLCVLFQLVLHTSTIWCFACSVFVLCWLSKNELEVANHKGYTQIGIAETLKKKEWKYLCAFFTFLILVPIVINPANLKSHNERIEFGPCDTVDAITNVSPLESYTFRRKYLCPNDTQYGYDFHCVPPADLIPTEVRTEYTVCGSAFEKPFQIAVHLAMYSFVCLAVLHYCLSFSLKTTEELEKMKNCKKVD